MSQSSQGAWREKSLEELEGLQLGPPAIDSYLVRTVHRLHKKPIGQFTVEDLRIMIGQGKGLSFLVPLALDALGHDPLAEGDFYEGDLLKAVLSVDFSFWREHVAELQRLSEIATRALKDLGSLDTADEIRDDLRSATERLFKLRDAAV